MRYNIPDLILNVVKYAVKINGRVKNKICRQKENLSAEYIRDGYTDRIDPAFTLIMQPYFIHADFPGAGFQHDVYMQNKRSIQKMCKES